MVVASFDRHPRRSATAVAALAAIVAGIAAGPVAAALAAAYAAVPLVVVAGRRAVRAESQATARALDLITLLAGDLRAGADPAVILGEVMPTIRACGVQGARIAHRVDAAVRVAEITGARLADLLDRLETDVRGLARARGAATTQAAGAEATAWLLAALPVAGIALGYGIGADPAHVLLHTRIGALCALAAVGFQIAGLAWSHRLARTIVDEV